MLELTRHGYNDKALVFIDPSSIEYIEELDTCTLIGLKSGNKIKVNENAGLVKTELDTLNVEI